MRVSKCDGSQTLDCQRDALPAAGVAPERLYEDLASGRKDAQPGLTACLEALQPGNWRRIFSHTTSVGLEDVDSAFCRQPVSRWTFMLQWSRSHTRGDTDAGVYL